MQMIRQNKLNVPAEQITIDDEFNYRSARWTAPIGQDQKGSKIAPACKTHIEELRKMLRNKGELEPVTLWRELNYKGEETGRLVLLDGRYRLAAYLAEASAKRGANARKIASGVPAVIVSGTREDAHISALGANTKVSLPMTNAERMDAAWKFVRKFGDTVSKPRVAKASGVSDRTVLTMRNKLKEFEAAGEPPLVDWNDARVWPEENTWTPPTSEERDEAVKQLTDLLRKNINESNLRNDTSALGDALWGALGGYQAKVVFDYLFVGDTDDVEFPEENIDEFDGVEKEKPEPRNDTDF